MEYPDTRERRERTEEFCVSRMLAHGTAPTWEEIMQRCGHSSKSMVSKDLEWLTRQDDGMIRLEPIPGQTRRRIVFRQEVPPAVLASRMLVIVSSMVHRCPSVCRELQLFMALHYQARSRRRDNGCNGCRCVALEPWQPTIANNDLGIGL